MEKIEIGIVGSGMGSLSVAALLASKGHKPVVFEQNWQPGGCTSSYWRKGFVFEAGATTLVGLGKGMPLQYVLDQTGIELKPRKLEMPMQVHLSNGEVLNKYESLEDWIGEAERVFGKKGQRQFWKACYEVSEFVWSTSLKQKHFPPSKVKDLLNAAANVTLSQLKNVPNAFVSVQSMLIKYGLDQNQLFLDFVNEQLLITAQNHASEVNFLFGATALCYTNFPNYYMDGGLLNLVNPFIQYIEERGGKLKIREGAQLIEKREEGYLIKTKETSYLAEYIVSGIPINNTFEIYPGEYQQKIESKLMESNELNSAFQMGIGFKPHRPFDSIHHQIHLEQPLAETGSDSIFISLNHPDDKTRTDEEGLMVMSVSTHAPDPGNKFIKNELAEEAVIQKLESLNFLKRENIKYQHSSTPRSWSKWTGRKWGFVGGYPQYMNIKPWQMLDARLDGHKAYLVGDTAYPGQGIPGVTLSGIIAFEKMCSDWKL